MKTQVKISIVTMLFLAGMGESTELRFGRETDVRRADVRIKKYSDIGSLSPGRLGDINGDGYEDFAIGDWRSQAPGPPAVGIFFGKPQWDHNLTFADADLVIMHEYDDAELGYKFPMFPGDLNEDGYDDVVLAGGSSISGGPVYMIYGKAVWPKGTHVVTNLADVVIRQGSLGYKAEYVGDFNGDGFDDLAIWEFAYIADFYIIHGTDKKYTTWDDVKKESHYLGTWTDTEGFAQLDWNDDGKEDICCSRGYEGVTCLFGKVDTLPNGYVQGFGCLENFSDDLAVCVNYVKYMGFDTRFTFLKHSDYSVNLISGDENDQRPQIGNGRVYVHDVDDAFRRGAIDLNIEYYFLGEHPNAGLGVRVTYAGDVDSDGYEDFLFSGDTTRGTGAVYCALSGPGKWQRPAIPAAEAEMSFYGWFGGELLGTWLANVGDVNGDAIDDWCFGGKENAYLVFPALNQRPSPITAIRFFTDANFTVTPSRSFKIWERVYVEVEAADRDPSTRNVCEVTLHSQGYPNPRGLKVRCKETGTNTGRFRSSVLLSDTGFSRFFRRARVLRTDRVEVVSWEDRNITASFSVQDVTPTPSPTMTPTKTPTITPTPTPVPQILVAGYWDTRLAAGQGGALNLVALVGPIPPTPPTFHLFVKYGGAFIPENPVFPFLFFELRDNEGPFPGWDGVWGLSVNLASALDRGEWLLGLEIRPGDIWGEVADQWPYLEVKP